MRLSARGGQSSKVAEGRTTVLSSSPTLDAVHDAVARFRVLITASYFEPGFRGGGPVRSIAQIVDTLSPQIDATLVTQDRDLGAVEPYDGLSGCWADRGRARVFYLDVRRPSHWMKLWHALRDTTFDVLYVNSIWSMSSVLPILAVRLGILRVRQVLLAPRGECSAGAISLKARKKRVALTGWRRVLDGLPVLWHATTEQEAAEIRATFAGAKVEIGGANCARSTMPAQALPPGPVRESPARLVFVGRITAMKNLRLTLSALAQVRGAAEFHVYGPVEDAAYWRECQSLVRRLPCNISFSYRGELRPEDVRRAFAEYDYFVFPTLGESFGHVVVESLSASCPVICSDRTTWSRELEAGGGVVLNEITPRALAARIELVAAMSGAERRRAKEAAGKCYNDWRSKEPDINILDRLRTGGRSAGQQMGSCGDS